MDKAPEGLKGYYAGLAQMREMSENMKKNQSLRGVEKLKERMAYRATNHKTWRQMKGMQWWMHEMNHPGNQAFVIGFAATYSFMLYLYFQACKSESLKLESKYYQRFHAKKEQH